MIEEEFKGVIAGRERSDPFLTGSEAGLAVAIEFIATVASEEGSGTIGPSEGDFAEGTSGPGFARERDFEAVDGQACGDRRGERVGPIWAGSVGLGRALNNNGHDGLQK